MNSSAATKEGVVDLKVSYDMGWERKGNGRAYNSRSDIKKMKRSRIMRHELVIASSMR